ncbi:MAG: DUF4919 domain-containing protein [Acidobacteria bacterium]|nr:DUF4919 domain-containing protein [Acidobacteriota bacterium]
MKSKHLLALIAVFLFTFAGFAQDNPKTETPVPPPAKLTAKDYEELVAKLKAGDTNIDYKRLRLAYTETKGYSYSGPDKAEREKFFKPFNDKNYKDALKEAEKYLEKMYVDANAHYVAYTSAKELKDDKKAEFHKAVLLGLLNSIKDGNDGLSEKTPYLVISIDEEYTMLRFLGLQRGSQGLLNKDGHTFDVLTATDPKTSQTVKIYFNIDIVWAAETKMFGGK